MVLSHTGHGEAGAPGMIQNPRTAAVRGRGILSKPLSMGYLHRFLLGFGALARGNGKLQVHFTDVGQGNGAVLVSPQGEVVLFADEVEGNRDLLVSDIQQLGVTKVNYHRLG